MADSKSRAWRGAYRQTIVDELQVAKAGPQDPVSIKIQDQLRANLAAFDEEDRGRSAVRQP